MAWAIPAVLAAAGLFAVPRPLPVPGPGAVIDAVKSYLQAVDEGDRVALERAFTACRTEIRCTVDDQGAVKEAKPGGVEVFFQDTLADGKVVTATDRKAVVALLADQIGGKARGTKTRIVAIDADCPGPECSWAHVEFERTVTRGEAAVTVPMTATVLVRYRDSEPRMGIFLWHASPRPEAAGKAK
jgi:hypothetical protein